MSEDKNYYLVFTADATEEQARAAFVARFKTEPERVYRMFPNNTVWAGPAPKDDHESN